MDKKYIIVFVVIIVTAAGFFIFKNQKNEKELNTHKIRQYNRLIEAAEKNTLAGLGHMGRALNKYRQEKGSYPDNLSALYPDYIPVESFIDDIQWYYEKGDKDFYLRKTIYTEKNKMLIAAIGSDLRPIAESGIMVASSDTPKRLPAQTESKPIAKIPEASITLASATNSKLITETVRPDPNSTDSKPGDSQRPLKSRKSTLFELEPVSKQKLSEKEHFVQKVRGNFLVWKNDDGTLGFGNIQYPTSEKMTIYDQGEWVQIRLRSPKTQTIKAIGQRKQEKAGGIGRLIAANSGQVFVWKDPEGIICFSNVQYPPNQNIKIYVEGRWQSIIN